MAEQLAATLRPEIEEISRMTDAPTGGGTVLLSNRPAGRGERLFAFAIIVASSVLFLVLAPFAKLPLVPVPAFIPIYQSALVINDVITVVFLLGQRQFRRSNALSYLAGGYLFTALLSIVHALTFPGLFSPTGLLDAGPQTTAWLYMFWHGGFPLFVIGYAICGSSVQATRLKHAGILIVAGLVCAAAFGVTLLATWGQHVLPAIMQGNQYTPIMNSVVWSVWMLNLVALAIVARRRPYSELDLWLTVVMCAWLFDIALSAGLDAGRYDLGFYAGRIYGLAAASFILIVLLVQNGKLYVQLIALRESDREKTDELRRLTTTDPLTGIANRRAFEEALDQEWRRMMRHQTALSLLMIDVDYFKRFNDRYGHVAGDQCLRVVAQALSRRTRRAGELAARYGGEEFAVLLPHVDIVDAEKLAELISASIREQEFPHEGSEVSPYITVSIGVGTIADLPKFAAALSREGALPSASLPSAMALVEMADHALYQAKIAGRNRVVTAGVNGSTAAAA
jgi:diguanylate cyclase (GGDEF)-like protein